jgi:hypothetical protein
MESQKILCLSEINVISTGSHLRLSTSVGRVCIQVDIVIVVVVVVVIIVVVIVVVVVIVDDIDYSLR